MKDKIEKPWTVLALDENDGQTVAAHVVAPDAETAIRQWATANPERDCCVVIGAVEGHVQLHPPCESGASAHVADLAEEPECGCGRLAYSCRTADDPGGLHGDRR